MKILETIPLVAERRIKEEHLGDNIHLLVRTDEGDIIANFPDPSHPEHPFIFSLSFSSWDDFDEAMANMGLDFNKLPYRLGGLVVSNNGDYWSPNPLPEGLADLIQEIFGLVFGDFLTLHNLHTSRHNLATAEKKLVAAEKKLAAATESVKKWRERVDSLVASAAEKKGTNNA